MKRKLISRFNFFNYINNNKKLVLTIQNFINFIIYYVEVLVIKQKLMVSIKFFNIIIFFVKVLTIQNFINFIVYYVEVF